MYENTEHVAFGWTSSPVESSEWTGWGWTRSVEEEVQALSAATVFHAKV